MKSKLTILVAAVLAVVAAILILVYGFGMLQRGTADFRGETSQIEQTKADANYRIASYDHFYDLCAGVQSLESKISNMVDELEITGDDTQRKTVLNTSITASKNKRAELIATYNADARKEATRGQFKASELPYELFESEESTICESY